MNRTTQVLLLLAVLVLSVAAIRPSSAPAQAQQWEYSYMELEQVMPGVPDWPGWREGSVGKANQMAEGGWQVLQALPIRREDNSLRGVGLYFRRLRP